VRANAPRGSRASDRAPQVVDIRRHCCLHKEVTNNIQRKNNGMKEPAKDSNPLVEAHLYAIVRQFVASCQELSLLLFHSLLLVGICMHIQQLCNAMMPG